MMLYVVIVPAAEANNRRDWWSEDPVSHVNGVGWVQVGKFHVPDTSASDRAQ